MNMAHRNVEDVEQALCHLMYQFRQIDRGYGLIVDKEINKLYQERKEKLETVKKEFVYLSTDYKKIKVS